MPLTDRVAVVTGATGGLGRVVARELAADGARLGLIGTMRDRLELLASELDLTEDRWVAAEGDLRSKEAAAAAVDVIAARFGSVDILVHTVGGYLGGAPVTDLPDEDVTAMLDQHLWTGLNIARAVVPRMTAAGWGRIVGVSTPVASTPAAKMAPYAIGKAAQEALFGTLAREVAGSGVTVNLVLVRKIDIEHERDREPTPKNAWWTTPEEIVETVRYLCSDGGRAVNGSKIPLFGSG
jgi:NAD(P)-dependent dehydrogenase (short-subunit alcohol dehydrogenase family)